MSQASNKLYEFGLFRLDAAERVLWRGDELIVLPPKVFDTLWMLIRREGGVVSKSELMETIWADAFVEESNLSQNIYTLRRTLGVDDQGRQFIETVPRRGYRFAAPVRLLDEVSTEVTETTEEALNSLPASPTAASLEGQFEPPSTPPPPPLTTETSRVAATSARPNSAVRYGLSVGLGILILSALGIGLYRFLIRGDSESKPAPIEQLRFQRLTDSGDVVFPTISPNGDLLAYVRQEEEEASVWVKQITTGSTFQTLPPSRKGYRSLAFSPDGRYLLFREGEDPGTIYQTSVFGGVPERVADDVWSDFSVSPDGRQFAFIRRNKDRYVRSLVLSEFGGTNERELSTREAQQEYGTGAPAWSPDSTTIVVVAGLRQDPRLISVDIATGREMELKTPRWRSVFRILWTQNGKRLIFSARSADEPASQLWMLDYPNGEIRRLTNDLESYFWLSLSADGRMLVTRQQRIISHLWLLPDGDLKKAKQLTFGGRGFDGHGGLSWTPDGKIVFDSFASNATDLYSMNADGTNRVQLTANAGLSNSGAVVSANGRLVAFTSDRTGVRQVWRMDIDGRNQKQLTFGDDQRDAAQYAAFMPDGAEVFFIRQAGSSAAIWKVPADGGDAVQVSHLSNAITAGSLSISPDGRWVAYRHASASGATEARSEERTFQIGVLPTVGNSEPKMFELQMRRPLVQWAGDSASFCYVAGTYDSSSMWRQPLNGDKPQKLIDFPDRIFNFAWSLDRKNLVVSSGKLQGDAILITNLP